MLVPLVPAGASAPRSREDAFHLRIFPAQHWLSRNRSQLFPTPTKGLVIPGTPEHPRAGEHLAAAAFSLSGLSPGPAGLVCPSHHLFSAAERSSELSLGVEGPKRLSPASWRCPALWRTQPGEKSTALNHSITHQRIHTSQCPGDARLSGRTQPGEKRAVPYHSTTHQRIHRSQRWGSACLDRSPCQFGNGHQLFPEHLFPR